MNDTPPLQYVNSSQLILSQPTAVPLQPRPLLFNTNHGRTLHTWHEVRELDRDCDGSVEDYGDFDFQEDLIDDEDDVPVVVNVRKVSVPRKNEYLLRSSAKYRGFLLEKDVCIELKESRFMRILHIARNIFGKVILIGNELSYALENNPVIEAFANELFWHIREDLPAIDEQKNSNYSIINSSGHSISCTGLHIRPIEDVIRKRTIVFTNWPLQNFQPSSYPNGLSISFDGSPEKSHRLFCRWKSTEIHDNVTPKQGKITKLAPAEADILFQTNKAMLRTLWRGTTSLGGSNHGIYTLGDSFCGGGGVSTGARLAGLHISWAFDINQNAIEVYNLNADTRTTVMRTDVYDFIVEARNAGYQLRKVDVLHLSPPCQPFSPANTTPNIRNNELNEAVLLSCSDLIEFTRPRIVTIEQTAGLLLRHVEWFYRFLRLLVQNDYSVRWKIMKFEEYGVPQRRHRLIMIAAGPGEDLPSFPEATTSPHSAVRPPTPNIEQALQISPEATHQGRNWYPLFKESKIPYDPRKQASTITTGGGENYHPSGVRGFSVRELACLQTFPEFFQLPHSVGLVGNLRRIVGNAVPPKFAEILFSHLVRHLKQSDIQEITNNMSRGILGVPALPELEIIEIDD